MTNSIAPTERAGHSDIPRGTEQTHTLIVFIHDRPGSVDRVVGLFRRRRASMQTLMLAQSEQPGVVRVSVVVNDSEVAIEQLVEQLRKIVDVQQVVNLASEQAVARELALIKVSSVKFNTIIELGHLFGAHVVDITPETVTLEVTGSEEKIDKLVEQLQEYGVREVARSGCVTMARGA